MRGRCDESEAQATGRRKSERMKSPKSLKRIRMSMLTSHVCLECSYGHHPKLCSLINIINIVSNISMNIIPIIIHQQQLSQLHDHVLHSSRV